MNRRDFVLGLAATVAWLPLFSADESALAQSGARFRSIAVDTRPLEARGDGAASIIRPRLQASLQSAFAGRVGAGGRGSLVVRIHRVYLSMDAGQGGHRFGGSSGSDYLEGELIVDGASRPLLVTQNSDSAGAWYLPDNEIRRLHALADAVAGWARRMV